MGYFQDTMHRNVSMRGLKAICKTSKARMARLVIDIKGKWHAGDGQKYTHPDIGFFGICSTCYDDFKIVGYVYCENGDKFTYILECPFTGEPYKGPESDRLEKYGFIGRPLDEYGNSSHPSSLDLGVSRRYIKWY
jgi:hypothetical protein